MKIYTILFALFLLVTIPTATFAGDYAELEYIGVSKDGKYMAFEEYGEQDGSGYAYSNIFFVEIATNKYAAKPIRMLIQDEKISLEMIRAKAKKAADKHLKSLKIIKGNNGKLVVARLLTDSASSFSPYKDGNKVQTIKFSSEVGSMYQIGNYELMLEPLELEGKKDYVESSVYKLNLKLKNVEKGTTKFLQKDQTLPKSRGLPVAYKAEKIYLYGDKIIVFINKFTSGFEGPDMRYMVVTGKM